VKGVATLAVTVSSVVTAPDGAPSRASGTTLFARLRGRGLTADFLLGLLLTTALMLVAFIASGGIDLAANTWVQVALIAVGAAAAITVVVIGALGRAWGVGVLLLFGALAALTYASITWSVQPATSWLEANRTLSYLAAFGTALALARLVPGRWRAVVGAMAASATLICGYALLVKVFPGTFDPNEPLGRLLQPFGYWNATGLMAAMGVPACLWAGARRERAPVLRTLSVPAISILVSALVLSYSRGSLVVAAIGAGVWFVLVPLRLRGGLLLILGLAGGAAISAWALATHSLSADGVSLSARSSAGHTFGLVILVVLCLTAVAGFAATFAVDRFELSPRVRRRVGTVLVGLVALVPVGGVLAVAASKRGLTGEVSHVWNTLTNPNGVVSDQPGRLIALSNSRPHYWSEGLTIGEHHLLAGVGALGFATAQAQYSSAIWNSQHAHVVHAHGYLIETFADFGLIGVAVTLALLVAWAIASRRSLALAQPQRAPPGPPAPGEVADSAERIGLLTLFAVVVTFGVHSLIDWTWFIPGDTVAALVCAGWLAGRGPLRQPVGRLPRRRRLSRSPGATVAVASVVVIALLAIWVTVQPLRSSDAYSAAINSAIHGNGTAALTDARTAAVEDPVSIDPLFLMSQIYTSLGNHAAARRDLGWDRTGLQALAVLGL